MPADLPADFERPRTMGLYKDVFQGQGPSLVSFLGVSALLCCAVGLLAFVALRGRAARPLAHALHAAAISGVLRVTLLSDFGHQETGECVIGKDLLEGFTTQQGIANLLLFLPVGLLGTLATRRPAGMLLWSVLLTTGVEITQAIVPGVARVCETGDLVMNVSGAWIGVLLATGWSAIRRRPLLGMPFGSRAVSVIAAVIALALTTVALTGIRPVVMDFTAGEREATEEQHAAVTEHFLLFLNGAVEMPGKEFVRYGGTREGGTVSVDLAEGIAGLDWPGGLRFDAAFPRRAAAAAGAGPHHHGGAGRGGGASVPRRAHRPSDRGKLHRGRPTRPEPVARHPGEGGGRRGHAGPGGIAAPLGRPSRPSHRGHHPGPRSAARGDDRGRRPRRRPPARRRSGPRGVDRRPRGRGGGR
ncbi:VanZ family protein [Streptomyces calidiresistens]|uniref:VanZ family protein n=1 Tax=Streptomyces calidiresistens TaxID=1485586 RepID=UPI0015FA0903|nr:VanZ family protein [Streptomyces calidiresistens]